MNGLWRLALGATGLWAAWLLLRCPLGWHAHPLRERTEVFGLLRWRCPRCMRVIGETNLPPAEHLRQRPQRQQGRVLEMRRRA